MLSFVNRLLHPSSEHEERPTSLKKHVFVLLQQKVNTLPYIDDFRIFWKHLDELRPHWAVILPLLAWVGIHTYQKERQTLVAHRASTHTNDDNLSQSATKRRLRNST